ncbi:hypothetical protein [Erythrobacter sp. JK5]|uniref:hypothetical protein n=1 Tax=Erythrobacter sp. JK5 TaxID=2829500 RepID=UPI001BA60453|nr:hypothetical protein [Erythrobacter sp. JK5]QUL37224.1 hypothetical protein KDC96_12685 [Erythrobacter sp. JK5]
MKQRALALAFVAMSLAACQTTGPATEDVTAAPDPPAFVEAACGGCHAVQPPFLSPNPQAPTFEAIANRDGLSEDTLAEWLADAHNYPEVMDFDLEPGQIDAVAEYMITLRRGDYRVVK